MRQSNLLKVLNAIEIDGYASYNLETAIMNPDWGYMISFQNHREHHDYCNIDLLSNYAKRKAHFLYKPDYFLQVFKDQDGYHFDLVQWITDENTGRFYAGVRSTRIWDNAKNDYI
ncbi:MAG: hypothetical protein ACK5DE_14030 [Bacteroidota bacterium]|jgi:hypothetical protein